MGITLNVAAHRHMAKARSRRQLICPIYGDRTHTGKCRLQSNELESTNGDSAQRDGTVESDAE